MHLAQSPGCVNTRPPGRALVIFHLIDSRLRRPGLPTGACAVYGKESSRRLLSCMVKYMIDPKFVRSKMLWKVSEDATCPY